MPRSNIKQILKRQLAGRAALQPLFQALHRLALIGMNYGMASWDVGDSGEKLVIRYLAKHVGNDVQPVVFDVGANIGDFSSAMLSVFGERVRLYTFEPSGAAFAKMSQKLAGYKNVRLSNFGLGEHNETAVLHTDRPGSEYGSLYVRRIEHIGVTINTCEAIEIRRIDNFCQQEGIEHIDLLKLDVEGNEFNVLRGGESLLKRKAIDLIQFELGRASVDARVFFKDFFYLLRPSYRIYRVLQNNIVEIDNYREEYEIFLTTNYLAVSRDIVLP